MVVISLLNNVLCKFNDICMTCVMYINYPKILSVLFVMPV
jgi:hypothetical protein